MLNNIKYLKLAIIGGRDFNDYNKLKNTILRYFNPKTNIIEIVSGGAAGADTLAKEFYERNKIKIDIKYTEFPADWQKFGKAAGPMRNKQIIDYSDIILAFWDGKSLGTKSSLTFAKKVKKDTIIIYY